MIRTVARSAAILSSGTIGGQLFLLAVSPVLTRLYGPSEFGVLGTFAATLYLVAAIAALRFDVAIPLAKDDSDADGLAALAVWIVACSGLLSFIGVRLLAGVLPAEIGRTFTWALPFGVFALGLYNVSLHMRLRAKAPALIAKTRVFQAMGAAAVQIGLGAAGGGSAGLIFGQIVGVSAGAKSLSNGSLIKNSMNLRFDTAIELVRKYANFPRYDTPASILSIANTHAPTIAIAILFSPSAAGVYALVQRVVITPFGLVSSALSSSLLSHAPSLRDQGSGKYVDGLIRLAPVLSPIVAIAAIAAVFIFPLIFGEKWSSSGEVAAWVLLFLVQKFIFDSVIPVLTVRNQQQLALLLQGLIFSFRMLLLVMIAKASDFAIALVAFSFATSAIYFLITKFAFKKDVDASWSGWIADFIDLLFPYFLILAFLNHEGEYFVGTLYLAWSLPRALLSMRSIRAHMIADRKDLK